MNMVIILAQFVPAVPYLILLLGGLWLSLARWRDGDRRFALIAWFFVLTLLSGLLRPLTTFVPQLALAGIPATTVALFMFVTNLVLESIRAIALLLLLIGLFRS